MPTRRGWAVLLAGVLCYAAALLLGYEELYVFAAASLAAFAIGALWVVLRPNLVVSREIDPQRVPRGNKDRKSVV